MSNDNYFKGYPDGKFLPEKQITRAEFISLFDNIIKNNYNLSKSDKDVSSLNKLSNYKDISNKYWAYNSIKNLWFYGRVFESKNSNTRNNIDNLFGKDSLKPAQAISRAEVSALLCKLVNDCIPPQKLSPQYKDCTNSKFASSIEVFKTYGIINGYPDNTFKPEQGIKRSEAAAMIKRLLDNKNILKKIKWNSDMQYKYDSSVQDFYDAAREVLKLELEGNFDQAYIYYTQSSKERNKFDNYRDYMPKIALHISRYFSNNDWLTYDDSFHYTPIQSSSDAVTLNIAYYDKNNNKTEDTVSLKMIDNKWYIELN
jgi:hypothetical protein